MIDKIFIACFSALFLITPLIWLPSSYELFEYNKMMFVYLLTILILGFWLIKMVLNRTLIFKRTPLDIPILLFLIANLLSTIFSIDTHVSIWGYYSRSNGGLISTICYIALYFAFVSNFSPKQGFRFLKLSLLSGFLVSLYAIPEHFGVSPSCVILNSSGYMDSGFNLGDVFYLMFKHPDQIFNVSCWQQDVKSRVFATFGQPNWLAAYLEILIFIGLYFLITAKKIGGWLLYLLYLVCYYLAFTFTDSRGATLGLLGGAAAFITVQSIHFKSANFLKSIRFKSFTNWRLQAIVLMIFIIINLLFGSAFTRFKLYFESQSPPSPTRAATTQLESGGTESGQIRWIVWNGAIDIFKHYPIFGSGVETFAYSYYQFRPVEHNLVSEWDFLYNKAHNEYLNYLSTTGLVGFITYLLIIFIFIFWSFLYVVTPTSQDNSNQKLFVSALLAAFIANLIQNFFLFSVVMTSLFFYLIPAATFVVTERTFPVTLQFLRFFPRFIYRRAIYYKALIALFSLMMILGVTTLLRFYIADKLFSEGNSASENGNVGRAYNLISEAVILNPNEPFYKSELAYAAAASSVSLANDQPERSITLKDEAVTLTQQVLNSYPQNVSWYRTGIRTYFVLSETDTQFFQQTLNLLDASIALAPTDPRLTYNKAVLLSQQDRVDEAITVLEKTIQLKPNYRDAHYALGLLFYTKSIDKNVPKDQQPAFKQKAVDEMNTVLKLIPGDQQAQEKLQDWQKK